MKMIFISFLAVLISMVAIDAVWLGLMFKRLYAPNIGHLMGESLNVIPALVFYLIFAVALTVLVISPAFQNNDSNQKVFLSGLLFGLVTYATYDLTNQATLKDWPVIVTVFDLVWGSLLTGIVSVISISVTRYFA